MAQTTGRQTGPRGGSVDESATADALMPVVYEQLRALAAGYLRRESQDDQILEPAVLVNETYLRLVDDPPGSWTNTEHFLAVAAIAMRKVLIDHARRRRALKRGFGRAQVSFEVATESGPKDVDVRVVDEAIRALLIMDERMGRIVELRFFAGLTHEQVAAVLGLSRKTVVKEWTRARDWLARELSDDLEHKYRFCNNGESQAEPG